MPLLKVLLQVKTHQKPSKYAPRKGLQVVAIAPNPIYSNYTKSRFFAVLVSDFPDKTLFGTYKKAHFGAFGRLGGQTKGAKGGGAEYLNAERTDKHRDNSHDNPQQAPTSTKTTGGGKFSTPGVVERRGGGVTPPITRGTKTGNKVLSLWKGGKRKWEKKKD